MFQNTPFEIYTIFLYARNKRFQDKAQREALTLFRFLYVQ